MNYFNKYRYLLRLSLCVLLLIGISQPALGRKFVVVIDPGHGGKDAGAVGRKGNEKTINLNVAKKLGNLIEANHDDVSVVYTRKTDVFIPLHRRAEIANEAKADLFISIHANSLPKRTLSISGTETYTLGLHRTSENLAVAKKENSVILIESDYKQRYAGFNPNSSESYIIFEFMQDKNMSQSVNFARSVQNQFKSKGRVNRGVHQAGFLVLRETSMPSVLIELGYISNDFEEEYMLSDEGSSTLARSIYDAFEQYKKSNRKGNSTVKQTTPPSDNPPTESTSPKAQDTVQQEVAVPTTNTAPAQVEKSNRSATPVFKIQILTSNKSISKNDKAFKGLSPIDSYKERGIIKYTYGESTDYNEIRKTLKSISSKFPDAFVIAFKEGEKVDVRQAIQEFSQNK